MVVRRTPEWELPMKPIVLSHSSVIAFRAVEHILKVLLDAEIELRDCTMRDRECVLGPEDVGLRIVELRGHFLFEGDTEHPEAVWALIQTRSSRSKDGMSVAHLEWDGSHTLKVNGKAHTVWFQNSKAFRVLKSDGKGRGELCECARSAEYIEAQTLPPEAKVFS
jgi:hypothetical protein